MRQKKLKFVSTELLESLGVICHPRQIDLQNYQKVALEIGSGKGKFITSLAIDNADVLYIAMELNMSVLYRIAEKKQELKLDNLIIVLGNAERLNEYFMPNSIDQIYLNFSDPWPKKKHHKRRLTAPKFLELYKIVLRTHGILQFRTDVEQFFDESLIDIKQFFDIKEINKRLEVSKYMTEYEEKKRLLGPIYQVIGSVKDVA